MVSLKNKTSDKSENMWSCVLEYKVFTTGFSLAAGPNPPSASPGTSKPQTAEYIRITFAVSGAAT